MRKKKWLLILMAVLLLTGCGTSGDNIIETRNPEQTAASAEDTTEVRLTVATSGSWENVSRGRLFDKYSKELVEWSNGDMVIQLYDDSVLGDDLQILEGVRSGTLNIINCVPSYLAPAVPEAALLDIPAMFSGIDEFNQLMDSGYFEVMQNYFSQNGLQLLSCRAFDMRQMTSNVPVREPADLVGLKLRTMETEYHVEFWNAMGAISMPMAFNQVKVSLQLGSIEAQENPLYYLESIQLNEVQDYVILTNHLPMISCFVMNKEQWDALTSEQQDLVQRFMDEMMEELVEETRKENEAIIEDAESELGVEVLEVSDSLRQKLDEANSVVIEMLREKLGSEKVNQYLAAIQEIRE